MAKPRIPVTVIVLGVIVVVALIYGSTLIAGAGKAWKDFWADFWLPWSDGGNGNGNGGNGTASGWAGIGLEVTYKDGTQKSFQPTDLSILPITITDTKGQVDYFKMILWGKVAWEGDLTDHSITMALDLRVTDAQGNLKGVWQTVHLNGFKALGDLENGVEGDWWYSDRYYASSLDQWMSNSKFPTGDYRCRVYGSLTFTAYFKTGPSAEKSVNINNLTDWNWHYEAGKITSLSVRVQVAPMKEA